jgi:cytochrome d ubiquinol oxidase subunit I
MLSILVHGDPHATVIGLDKFAREDRPPVGVSFFSYHVMVGLGTYFIVLTLLASFLRWRGTLFRRRWLMWVFVFSVVGAFAANELGWMAAESGRQPWIVHPRVLRDAAGQVAFGPDGLVLYHREEGLRTSEGVSEAVTGGQVLGSIIMFSFVYLLLFVVWVFVLNGKIHKGPVPVVVGGHTSAGGFASAAGERVEHDRR